MCLCIFYDKLFPIYDSSTYFFYGQFWIYTRQILNCRGDILTVLSRISSYQLQGLGPFTCSDLRISRIDLSISSVVELCNEVLYLLWGTN